MSFFQIIEYKTSRVDEIRALSETWIEQTKGARTATRSVLSADTDQPGIYVLLVEFPSRDDADRNSALPATTKLAEEVAKLCDGPPSFRNLDVVEDRKL